MSITILCRSAHHVCECGGFFVGRSRSFTLYTAVCTIAMGETVLPPSASRLWDTSTTSAPTATATSGASSTASPVVVMSACIVFMTFESEPHGFHVHHHGGHEFGHGRISLSCVCGCLEGKWRFLMIVVRDDLRFVARESMRNVVRCFLA